MSKERIIISQLNATRKILLAHSSLFSNAKHNDILGFCREALINDFLLKNCPSIIEYSTGEIIDLEDKRSGQIDIVMQTIKSPKMPLYGNNRLSFADTVFGAIEVKSNLSTAQIQTTSHLKLALDNYQKLRQLKRSSGDVYHKTIPYFIFAYKGPTIETLIKFIIEYSKHNNLSISECCPEVISVLDRGYSLTKDDGFIAKIKKDNNHLIKWDSDFSMSLAIPWIYISRKAEIWSQQNTFMNFADYFKI